MTELERLRTAVVEARNDAQTIQERVWASERLGHNCRRRAAELARASDPDIAAIAALGAEAAAHDAVADACNKALSQAQERLADLTRRLRDWLASSLSVRARADTTERRIAGIQAKIDDDRAAIERLEADLRLDRAHLARLKEEVAEIGGPDGENWTAIEHEARGAGILIDIRQPWDVAAPPARPEWRPGT